MESLVSSHCHSTCGWPSNSTCLCFIALEAGISNNQVLLDSVSVGLILYRESCLTVCSPGERDHQRKDPMKKSRATARPLLQRTNHETSALLIPGLPPITQMACISVHESAGDTIIQTIAQIMNNILEKKFQQNQEVYYARFNSVQHWSSTESKEGNNSNTLCIEHMFL